jgi:predicted transcriptional regulator
MDRPPLHFAIRIYAGQFQLDEIKTQNGKFFHLLSLPYYLTGQLNSYIQWLFDELGDVPEKPPSMLEEGEGLYAKEKPAKKVWAIDDLVEKHLKVLQFCATTPQKGRTIIEQELGLSYQSINKRKYLNSLRELKLLAFTIKDNERSKQQKYQITKKGRDLLKS